MKRVVSIVGLMPFLSVNASQTSGPEPLTIAVYALNEKPPQGAVYARVDRRKPGDYRLANGRWIALVGKDGSLTLLSSQHPEVLRVTAMVELYSKPERFEPGYVTTVKDLGSSATTVFCDALSVTRAHYLNAQGTVPQNVAVRIDGLRRLSLRIAESSIDLTYPAVGMIDRSIEEHMRLQKAVLAKLDANPLIATAIAKPNPPITLRAYDRCTVLPSAKDPDSKQLQSARDAVGAYLARLKSTLVTPTSKVHDLFGKGTYLAKKSYLGQAFSALPRNLQAEFREELLKRANMLGLQTSDERERALSKSTIVGDNLGIEMKVSAGKPAKRFSFEFFP